MKKSNGQKMFKNKKVIRKKFRLKPIRNKKELGILTKQIKTSYKSSALNLLRIYKSKNWKNLGFTSFKDFVEKCLPQENYETVLSWVLSAETMFDLGGPDAVGIYSMNATRVIKRIRGEQRKQLWLALKAKAKKSPTGKLTPAWLTAARVEEEINTLFGSELDDKNQDSPDDDFISDDEYNDSDGHGTSVSSKSDVPLKKSSKCNTSRPQKENPPSDIQINEANSGITSRVRNCEKLQNMLEEYDGSEPLAKMLAEFSVEHFNAKTLTKMKGIFIKGISRISPSEPKMSGVKS